MDVAAWAIETDDDVEDFIGGLDPVLEHEVRTHLKRLRSFGTKATYPLVANLKGDVYYLRCDCGARIFYFRNGPRRFRAFDVYMKKRRKLPGRIRKRVLKRFKQIKEETGQ